MKVHAGGGDLKEQEDIEILEYSYQEIPDLMKSGLIVDAKTLILLQWAMMNFKILI